jgi:hypothetical protein
MHPLPSSNGPPSFIAIERTIKAPTTLPLSVGEIQLLKKITPLKRHKTKTDLN